MSTEVLKGEDFGIKRNLEVEFLDVPISWGRLRASKVQGNKPDGPNVVIWGGYGSGCFTMASMVEALEEHAKTIIGLPNIRSKEVWGLGLGEVPGRIYSEALFNLGIVNPVLLGYSHGARMAIRTSVWAHESNLDIKGMILVNGALIDLDFRKVCTGLLKELLLNNGYFRRQVPMVQGSLTLRESLVMARKDPSLLEYDDELFGGRIRVPTVVVAARGDTVTNTPKLLVHLKETKNGNLRVVSLPGNHTTPIIRPKPFIEAGMIGLKKLGVDIRG